MPRRAACSLARNPTTTTTTHNKFRRAIASLNIAMSDADFAALMREIDENGDGVVNYAEVRGV